MFYVCEKRGDLYGIVDTDDGICEFYSERQIKNFILWFNYKNIKFSRKAVTIRIFTEKTYEDICIFTWIFL